MTRSKETVFILINNTGKKFYIAIGANKNLDAIELAISFDQKLLKNRYPERLLDDLNHDKRLKFESPYPNITFEYITLDNDSIGVAATDENDTFVITYKNNNKNTPLLN